MIFYGPDNREYRKQICAEDYIQGPEDRSAGEQWLYGKLQKLFPLYSILEQLPCFGTRLRLDFVILSPGVRIGFEFDGEQHKQFTAHFHGNRQGWAKAQLRDVEKDQWCENNSIILIRVDKMDGEALRKLIGERTQSTGGHDRVGRADR